MTEYRRLGIGCILAVVAVLILRQAATPLAALLALPLIVVAGYLVAPWIAGVLSDPGALFHPPGNDPPQPRYSLAESKRARGEYEEALEAYEDILAEHPTEVNAWAAMAEIAVEKLHDPERAGVIVRRALAALGDEHARLQLLRMYRASCRRVGLGPAAEAAPDPG